MTILFWILYVSLSLWIQGWLGKWASNEGAKKGYDPVWSAVNGVRFGLLATIYYKWMAPNKINKNIN